MVYPRQWCVLGSSGKTDITGWKREVKENNPCCHCILLGFTLKVIEKEKAEKSQKLDELKRSGHILLDQMGKGKQLEGFSLLGFISVELLGNNIEIHSSFSL